jgi:tetratricopeptide (TPR) repeat protein
LNGLQDVSKREIDLQFVDALKKGWEAESDGNFTEAKCHFRKALDLKPGSMEAKNGLKLVAEKAVEAKYRNAVMEGREAEFRKDLEASLSAYEKALSIFPGDPAATKAVRRIKQNLFTKAMRAAQEAFAAKDLEESEKAYKLALRYLPGDPKALDGIREINKERSRIRYETAMEEGLKAEGQKDWVSAIAAYKRARMEKPEDEEARAGIDRVFIERENEISSGPYGSRSDTNKKAAIQEYGGHETEEAVRRGLAWLASHQNPDGMWSCKKFMMNCKKGCCHGMGSRDDFDMGVTGLALLAFLGAGHTHRSGSFKGTVLKALKAIKERQAPDGCIGPKSRDGHWIYNHAIAAAALAEAYDMSGKSSLFQGPAQKAIDFLIDCQNPYLGWRYGRQTGENDSSVTGWAVMALKSAKISGLHVPEECFDGALNWFNKVTDEAYYRIGYTRLKEKGQQRPTDAHGKFKSNPTMTALGTLCRIFILGTKAKNKAEILGGGNLLKQNPPRWAIHGGTIDMYYWYWGALTCFQLGRSYWKSWNEPIRKALLPTQNREGCSNGSWDPVGVWGTIGGRVYSTAINTLTLEVYYRYRRILEVK